MDFQPWIRDVVGFPKPGIVFKDLTPLLADADAFRAMVDLLIAPFRAASIERICAIEARGFIFGAAASLALGCGFVPLRKPGKLPGACIGIDYALEYGAARIELDPGAIVTGERVLLVDDLIATGGTALAGAELLRQAGAIVDQALFVIDLTDLRGADALRAAGVAADALIDFSGH